MGIGLLHGFLSNKCPQTSGPCFKLTYYNKQLPHRFVFLTRTSQYVSIHGNDVCAHTGAMLLFAVVDSPSL